MIEAVNGQRKPATTVIADGSEPMFYTNHVQIDGSAHDVRLRVGVMVDSGPNGLRVKELAHVYMAHSHAIALFDALKPLVAQLRPGTSA